MQVETTHQANDTTVCGKLYMALELSNAEWKLGFTVGLGQPPRLRSLEARDLGGLKQEIDLATKRFGLSGNARVLSCYEAGRDGFSRRTWGRCGFIAIWRHRG
jgi:transposase